MKVVIVHGSNPIDREKIERGEPPQNLRHWIVWLKEKLEEKGYEVFNPLMPKNWDPNYKEWKEEFEKIPVDEETILIGHSAGGGFSVRWLGETKRKIKKLILIAPAITRGKYVNPKELLNFKINRDILKQINSLIIFTSDDEREELKEAAKIYGNELKVKPIELKKHGHFTFKGMGTKEFPELLEEVLR